jgi:hypothetical protein
MCFFSQAKAADLKWGAAKTSYSILSDAESRFVHSMLAECLRSKIASVLSERGIVYTLEVEEGFLPCQFCFSFAEEQKEKIQDIALALKNKDIELLQNFTNIQTTWMSWIQTQKNALDQTYWGEELAGREEEFLKKAEEVLHQVAFEDLCEAFQKTEEKGIGKITLQYEPKTPHLFETANAARSSMSSPKKGWEPPPGQSRGGQPKSEEAKLFFELPFPDEDKVTTRKLITSLADKNVLQLLLDRKSLEKKGDKVRHVHPLRFIGFILADSNLNRCMKSISKTTFTWDHFVEGFEKRMKEENKAGNLNRYVPGFADYMEADRNVVQRYINRGDYSGLIKYFL